jgi:hypothetical protein
VERLAHVLRPPVMLSWLLHSGAAVPPTEAWEIGPWARGKNYSVGMPAHPRPGPNGSLVVDLPLAGAGEVDALTTVVGPLAGAKQITLRYRVDAAPGARFVAVETPNEPATVSLYLQRAGDNWTARGRFASYRWYSPQRAVIPLTVGRHTVTFDLTRHVPTSTASLIMQRPTVSPLLSGIHRVSAWRSVHPLAGATESM